LGTVIYLYLDAIYEKVRLDGQVLDAAVLLASGVDLEGKRLILGVSVSLGEQELHWRGFLQSLVERGLNGVELIHQRCPRRFAGSPQSGVQRGTVGALPIPLATECQSVCTSPEHEARSGSRYPSHIQCP
jgi:hypothetical protein